MANSVVITNEPKASRAGEVAFTITNATNSAGKFQCKLRGIGQTKTDKFALSGGAQVDGSASNKTVQQLDLPAKGTLKITAKIDPAAPPGEYKISLLVWSVADPDGDCTEGQVCTVTQAPPVEKKPFPWAIVGIIAAVVVIGGGVGGYFALRPTGVEVPNLVGMQFDQAEQALQKAGLGATRNDVVNAAVAAGKVTAQDPAASAKVSAKATVALSVAKQPDAPPTVEVPKLIGLAFNDAQQALQNLGLALVRRDIVNNTVSAGRILDQTPPPSFRVAPKATVTLLVAKQEEAPAPVEVPKLTGMSFNEAQQLLQRIGLAAARNDAVNNTIAAEQVVAQSPAATTKVAPRAAVTLMVAKHDVPPPPPAPTFVDFNAPLVAGVPLDICREWGANCGKPAADAFCVRSGFAQAADFRTAQDSPPTRVIATNQICKEKFCDRISWVRCTKTSTAAVRPVFLDAAMMIRNQQKLTIAPR